MSQKQDLLLYPFSSVHQLPCWKKQPTKAITLSGSVVFVALQGFPWRAATVLASEKSSETDLESLGHPPGASQSRGVGNLLHPTSISIPNPILCPGAGSCPRQAWQEEGWKSRGDRACSLSSAAPAAAGGGSECSKRDRDGHTRGIRVSREQIRITTGHAH